MDNVVIFEERIFAFVRERVAAKLEVVGALVESAAQNRCPVITGNLRNSIVHKVDEKELTVTIGTNTEYAPYVEFGTGEFAENGKGRKGGWFVPVQFAIKSKQQVGGFFTLGQKPRPFLRPALEESIPEIKRILGVR